MDILGPFPPAKGQVKFLIVAVDHFTKWIEAETVATISANNVQKFFWKNVITRFGVPYALITDNGLQFTDRRFNEFLEGLQIKHQSSTKETPFQLAYGTDAMMPVEIGEPSLRRQQFTEEANTVALNVELDLIEEARDRVFINMEASRARVS
uniref:Integrase catalytic domain-containing protein n=1 Tax=Cajanus cajan TaxID=3821 RepID=A0A151QM37_CAJCA|nr:hypothetical protein KK1_048369 [Cajanus cajan]